MTIIDLIDPYYSCKRNNPTSCESCLLNKGELCTIVKKLDEEWEKYYSYEDEV